MRFNQVSSVGGACKEHRKGSVQRRASNYILNLGFSTDIPYSQKLQKVDPFGALVSTIYAHAIRLQQLELITYWHEFLDV
jgi:hypothetical protein